MTSSGIPMSATARSPARSRAGGSTSGTLGAPSVTVSAAWMAGPITSWVSAETPLGRSIAITGTGELLTSSTIVSIRPDSGDFRPVPNRASTMRS